MTDNLESSINIPEVGSDAYWHLLTRPPLVQYVGASDIPEYAMHQDEQRWAHDNIRRVDAETQAAAARQLAATLASDQGVRDIVASLRPVDGDNLPALVDAIRSDAALRYELAMYFRDRLQANVAQLPNRVRQNGYKELNHGIYYPYDVLPSRDYAVMLAISMLDGTFNAVASQLDTVDVSIGKGTHRAAAQLLLR